MKRCFIDGSALLGVTFLHDIVGDLANAGANLIGTFVNANTQNKNTKRMIAAQKEENEKAYQRNLEMWNKENVYNSPTEVMNRLRAAGMNPNLAYGTPNVSAPSPDAPITDMSAMANMKSPVGSVLENSVNARYMNALISNMNAQTKKTEEEAKKTGAEYEAQMTYNQYQEQILTGNLSEQKARIELNASQTDLNDMNSRESYTRIQNIMESTNKLKAEIDKIGAEIENIQEDTAIKRIEKAFREPILKAQLVHMYAQAKLANATAAKTQEEFNQLAASSIYNLLTKKEMANNEFLKGLVYQNTASELQIKIDTESYDLNRKRSGEFLDDISKVCGTFSNVVGSVTDVFTFGYRQKYVWK